MGDLAAIGFTAGSSQMHMLDPRTKQLLVLSLSLASITGSLTFLTISSLALVYSINSAQIHLFKLLYAIRYFLFFLVIIFLIRTVHLDEQWQPHWNSYPLIFEATLICWRLFFIALMCLLLMATTRTTAIRAALIWFLQPLPLINQKSTATMVGLLVRFLPLILLLSGETTDAMRARCIENRKNPIRRLSSFSISLFRRVFLRADEVVDAMQARCYNENRTLPQLCFAKRDLLAIIVGILLMLTTLFP